MPEEWLLSPLWQMMSMRHRKVKYLALETARWIMESKIEQDSLSPEPQFLPTEVNLTCFCLSPCNTSPDTMSLFRLGGYSSMPKPSKSNCWCIWKGRSKWMSVLLLQTQCDRRITRFMKMSAQPAGDYGLTWRAGTWQVPLCFPKPWWLWKALVIPSKRKSLKTFRTL